MRQSVVGSYYTLYTIDNYITSSTIKHIMKKFAATLAASAAVVGTVVLCRRSIDNSVDPSSPNRRRLNVRMHLPLLFGDPKTVDLRCEDKGPCLPPGPVSKVPWSGIQNSQWCNEPLDDKHPAPPLDYTDCEGRQLLHMDNNGGMCAELNKILKVALWAARDHSCFFVDERPTNGSPHFHSHKLGYREDDNGKGFFMPDFMDRYFEHIGLYEDQWNSMVPFPINTPGTVSTDNYDIITPTPGQVKDAGECTVSYCNSFSSCETVFFVSNQVHYNG